MRMAGQPSLTKAELRILRAIDLEPGILIFELEMATLERRGLIEQVNGHFALTQEGHDTLVSHRGDAPPVGS
jgi:hypothetical protein